MDHKTTNVDEILKERGASYGSYGAGVSCRAAILDALNTHVYFFSERPYPFHE